MEKEEIDFFREKLMILYQNVTEKLLESKKEIESKIDNTKINNVQVSKKGKSILKSILKLGAKIIFLNKLSDDVYDSEFSPELDDLLKSISGKVNSETAKNQCYQFEAESIQYVIELFVKMSILLNSDEEVKNIANGMYTALDICEWNEYSDYVTALMFLFKSGLMTRKQFATAACVDNLHTQYNGLIKKYILDYPVLSDFRDTFKEYELKFGKKFEEPAKTK